ELYQVEGVPKGISIVDFCQRNGIVYKHFERWFKKRYSQNDTSVHRVRLVDTAPSANQPLSDGHPSVLSSSSPGEEQEDATVRLFVTIRTSQGLSIQQNNLTYRQLLSLVEKLEVLC
ncbi:MAG: hypothetical protein ACI4C3_08595, partial [Bacteroides sp.]